MSHRLTDTDLKNLQAYLDKTGSPVGFKPSPVKHNRNEESQSQQAVIKWWDLACKGFSLPNEILFSIPNGGARDARTGNLMKKEGQRRGVPDLMVAVPMGGKAALFLEMKTATGRLSPEQIKMHAALTDLGYVVQVCRSSGEAIDAITKYLKG